ncbi:type II toxin-antitoxin system HicA family toxin [Pseudorhizobium tarimense]|uniref:type II toxin-antitoxin system HicA family toxin n=1 Tax=Pseudorhizobium tarimense TaxID=1079109 RepID=UPI001FF45194|nr:type II toxin-antitoxin system HicA family toxin [Pseudorhizobium tarimense]MCJ8521385.1 type II toxin-antitoxin system HicA family toxin [Pseudorhizobium tarimense]
MSPRYRTRVSGRWAPYLRELKELLTAAGCKFFVRPGKGDHEIWFSPITSRHFTVDHGVKSRHTANETLKQAGLPKSL